MQIPYLRHHEKTNKFILEETIMKNIMSNNANIDTNELKKAYAFLRIKGNTVMTPAVLDRENGFAYLYTPSEAGNVDVVRYHYNDILFNAVNPMPGFLNISLAEQRGIPVPMSTKVHTGCFAKVRQEIATTLLAARAELIAHGPRVQCS